MPPKSKIQDQTFLFTGTLTEFTREEAEALVEANGGKVLSSVTAKLNYLVVGEDAGSKLDKAKKLGTVKILTEKEFLKMAPKAPAKSTTAKGSAPKAETKSKSKVEATSADAVADATEIKIGQQVWMSGNLNVVKFRNGDAIKIANSAAEWSKLNEKGTPACCYYGGVDTGDKNRGLLYNWFAVSDKRGLAPTGWEIPSLEDWNQLVSFVGDDKKGVRKLKSKEIWDGSDFMVKNSNGTNETGFNLLPTGRRDHPSGTFYSEKTMAQLWTSNPAQTKSAYFVEFNHENKYNTSFTYKQLGYAVRCIKK